VLAMIIWGGTWPAGKLASVATRPALMVFRRFALTALAFLPVLLAMRASAGRTVPAPGDRVPRLSAMPARAWLYTLATAAAIVSCNFLFFGGLRLGLAGVVVGCSCPR